MQKNSFTRRWISLAIVAMLFFSPAFLQGCDSLMATNDPDTVIDLAPTEKLRHQHMLDKALKPGKSGSATLNLNFSVDSLQVLGRYRILDRN